MLFFLGFEYIFAPKQHTVNHRLGAASCISLLAFHNKLFSLLMQTCYTFTCPVFASVIRHVSCIQGCYFCK